MRFDTRLWYREASEEGVVAHTGDGLLRLVQHECGCGGLGSACLTVSRCWTTRQVRNPTWTQGGKKRCVLRGWARAAGEKGVEGNTRSENKLAAEPCSTKGPGRHGSRRQW